MLAEKKLAGAQRGRPRSLDKKRAILEAAGDLFIENGFGGTSMDEVARQANVSKQTIYSHFDNKDQLFVAVIEGKMQDFVGDDLDNDAWRGSAASVVPVICRQVQSLLVAPDAVAMYRVLVGGANLEGHEHMAELFYQIGPQWIKKRIGNFLRLATERGELKVDDPEDAAIDLVSLLRGEMYMEATLGLRDDFSEAEIRSHADKTAQKFLRLYAPSPSL